MSVAIKREQLAFLDWEFGVFFHFGIRTFYEGHADWDCLEMPLLAFDPVELDCRTWIDTVCKAGAKYAILVAKHHDGFANWPSAFTEYGVKNTPWKGGKGDVVREFTDACREYGVNVGLYYSPAEFGSAQRNGKDYDEYFIHQISELLTDYGRIDYLWFDGCGSEGHEYDQLRIVSEIRRLQPHILIFNMWDPDVRWVGNEAGLADSPNANFVDSLDFSIHTSEAERLGRLRFLPAECDCRMRRDNWFCSDSDEDTVKSLDELMGLYYYSVGRGANLLLNIGPDQRGLLPERDKMRLIEFGDEVKRRFDHPLAVYRDIEVRDGALELTLERYALVNHLILSADVRQGDAVRSFIVKAFPYRDGRSVAVYQGTTIGHKAICPFPSVYTHKLQIDIEGDWPVAIKEIMVCYVG